MTTERQGYPPALTVPLGRVSRNAKPRPSARYSPVDVFVMLRRFAVLHMPLIDWLALNDNVRLYNLVASFCHPIALDCQLATRPPYLPVPHSP